MTNYRNREPATGLLLVLMIITGVAVLPSHAASPFEPRKSDAAGVQVVVTPKVIDHAASTWEFEVVMDTHTKPLVDDLIESSVLIADGQTYAANGWDGDKPGGHHRKGQLRFPRPAGIPKLIELRIKGVGGEGQRSFRWELK